MKKCVYSLVLLGLIYGCAETISWSCLWVVARTRHVSYQPADAISPKQNAILRQLIRGESDYTEFSPTLGWTIKKNGRSGLYQANSAGIRGDKEYELHRPGDVLRIATFGDSFTHGDAVANAETWQARIENADRKVEVMNFGVGGYGLDQAYLRYDLEGRRYNPQIVVIGFMTEDIARNVNSYRPFYYPDTGLPLAKPRYCLSGERLSLLPNPMQSVDQYARLLSRPREELSAMGRNDYYYKWRYTSSPFDWSPTIRIATIVVHELRLQLGDGDKALRLDGLYAENSEAYRLTQLLFGVFYDEVRSQGSMPIIVVFPSEEDVRRYQQKLQKRYATVLSYFDLKGYRYIDMMDAFKGAIAQHKGQDLFVADHYSPYANALVAEKIRHDLVDQDL